MVDSGVRVPKQSGSEVAKPDVARPVGQIKMANAPRRPRGKTIPTMHRDARKPTLFAMALEQDGADPKPENIIHEGYLLKSVPVYNGMGMKWRKRYCKIFTGLYPTMTVQLSDKQDTPEDSIPLDDATFRVPNRKKNTGVSFVFEVKNKKYSVQQGHLFAMLPNEGGNEMAEWMRQMKMAGRQGENKSRCQKLTDELTDAEQEVAAREKAKLMSLPFERVEEIYKELQEEEDSAVVQTQQKYVDLKCKMVDLLGERFGQEFHSLGKVVPHNMHDSESPLQKPWSVLVSRPSSFG